MKQSVQHSHSPFRIFAFSTIATLFIVGIVLYYSGPAALFITLVLLLIEITFSFENAIINAKILVRLSRFWQNIFLTIGIFIAIFGMRIVFPIAIVAISANLPWRDVLDLALNNPSAYAAELDEAAPTITAFGGAFLLMLASSFFFDRGKGVHWFGYIEQPMQKIGYNWIPFALSFTAIGILSLLPANEHPRQTFISGVVGILTFICIHGLSSFFGKSQTKHASKAVKTGFAAFWTFLYLELLDASFSLDGVIGAFAITNQVILIAAGLGAGAIWVRSMTIFMVRRGTLQTYRYLEHGAFYTVSILSGILILESLVHIPEAIAGLCGLGIIISSVITSQRFARAQINSSKSQA